MKKLQQRLLMFLPIFLLLIVPLKWAEGQTAPAVAAETAQMKATVVKVSGGVRIRNHGSVFWHDAKVNEVIGTGSQIETKENGQIEIKLENNNVINLKPNTKLILRKLTANLKTGDYENLLESNIGKIRAKVEKIKGGSRFEIKTPTAVACVRGTIMYLVAYPDSTIAFFEEGTGFVTNPFSGQTFDVAPGNVYQVDQNGNVSGPVTPTAEQLQDIIEGWNIDAGAEGYSEGDEGGEGGGDEGVEDDTDDTTEDQEDSQNEAEDDKQSSQNTELTEFEGSDLLGGGDTSTGSTTTTETDTDGDGTPDSTDNDDDNDGLPDALEARWNDTNLNTDPLDADTDDDGVNDIEDAFPKDATRTGSRDSIRPKEKELIDFARLKDNREDYLQADEREALREDIDAIIDDNENRRIDGVLEQIADAQTGKVLTDRQGNRVRVEQYVLRPSSDTVEVLNVNLRTAGEHAGLSTLDWITRFGDQNLDSLTGEQLRALPWNDYLEAPTSGSDLVGTGPKYSSNPSYYPTFMSVELRNPSENSFYEERALAAPVTSGANWTQQVTRDQISVNDEDLMNFTVNRSFSSGSGNPNGFKYIPDDESDEIFFRFYAISDDPNVGRVAVANKNFNNMWEALAVNMDGAPSRMNIGNNNLEIRITSESFSKDIDVIYVPFARLDWNDSHDWLNDEGPR